MRLSPSIVPPDDDRDVYMVLNDFGRLGSASCEADEHEADRETIIRDLIACQYDSPLRVIVFNTEQNTSRDVSAEIATELVDRCDDRPEGPPEYLHEFLDRYGVPRCPIQLSLAV
jgi:hypothetical protein